MKRFLVVLMVVSLVLFFSSVVLAEYSAPAYYLVAGSYTELENAENQQSELLEMGYYSRLFNIPIDGTEFWRVVVKESPSEEKLYPLKKELEKKGFNPFLVFHGVDEPSREVQDPEPVEKKPSLDDVHKLIQERFEGVEMFLDWLWKMLR